MKRRLKFGEPSAELLDFRRWGESAGVYVAPDLTPLGLKDLAAARAAVAERERAWEQWGDARRRFAEQYGWPEGEMKRKMAESAAYPGGPFDPDSI